VPRLPLPLSLPAPTLPDALDLRDGGFVNGVGVLRRVAERRIPVESGARVGILLRVARRVAHALPFLGGVLASRGEHQAQGRRRHQAGDGVLRAGEPRSRLSSARRGKPQLVVSLLTLGDPGRLTGGYLFHRRMAEAAPRHGARVVFLSFPERPFPLAAAAGPGLVRRACAGGSHVLVLDSIVAALAAPWLSLRPYALPVVAMLHQPPGGVDHGPVRTRLQAPLDRLAYRRAGLLLVASDLLAEALTAQGIAREHIVVVPPGRDVASAPSAPARDLRDGRGAAFLCVANWIRHKGILELLDAFARLPPEAGVLHLAGHEHVAPAYAERVKERLARPDLSGRVVRHGPVSRDAVAELYAAADVFVLPALRESYGTVWGEATASGLPVVGWRAGNLPYLVDHGREGLMAAPGDVAGLSRALLRLAVDEQLRVRMGRAGRARSLARPTWDESAAAFFAALRTAA
jgi:glycosyltransferase involved in cell wall biosynthesis